MKREIDGVLSEMHQVGLKSPSPAAAEKQAVSTLNIKVSAAAGEGWKLVTSGTKKKAPAPLKGLQLQNRFTALKVEEKPDAFKQRMWSTLPEAVQRPPERKSESMQWVTPCCRR